MSRKPFIAGGKWTKSVEAKYPLKPASKLPSADLVEAGIAAPAVDLTAVLAAKGSNLKVAAQNTYFWKMLVPSLVKLAHKFWKKWYDLLSVTERRDISNETDEDINVKAKAIFANGGCFQSSAVWVSWNLRSW